MQSRGALIDALKHYRTGYPKEKKFIARFKALLEHLRSFHRDHLPGHITASCWIVDESRQFTLLTHHAKLNRWLQPGGHADGDENVMAVALREAQEETGLTSLALIHNSIFDIDIHPIPARPDFPQHDHYDIRFLFQASMHEPLTITSESNDLAWKPVNALPILTDNNESILRMAEKIRKLF